MTAISVRNGEAIRTLYGLAKAIPGARAEGPDHTLTGLAVHTDDIFSGNLFAALDGLNHRGSDFIPQALINGATAILDDGSAKLGKGTVLRSDGALQTHENIGRLIHPNPREALAHIAAAFSGYPDKHLKIIGITGTNGKTTVAAMLGSILNCAGFKPGIIGTTGIFFGSVKMDNPLTTPDPIALHPILAEMVNAECTVAIMEVSSHALEQKRTAGLGFQSAAFTNLSRDHLDYHGDLEHYFKAKSRLFTEPPPKGAVINLDDDHGQKLVDQLPKDTPWIGTTLNEPKQDNVIGVADISLSPQGTHFTLITSDSRLEVQLPSPGLFNVANALTAAALARQLGVTDTPIQTGLNRFNPAGGRLQPIRAGQPCNVFVDYAHTPEALERLLTTAREFTRNRIITVFGCGGDRDKGKRALMGEVAARFGDISVITDDNPRSEDPAAIRMEIQSGYAAVAEKDRYPGSRCEMIGDRHRAIDWALSVAGPNDTVLIAGKGHEQYQIVADRKIPFDDCGIALASLQRMEYLARPEGSL
ncbi:MAG: UDP-N-acetylmuramoyl-L-alanyl-D-glutamate--2,6-diaminopimelate ligase [Magnetococcales bacterium]|nr:UDP-N-acetylmuramoyl-L-alanyl-D-glutamate--2,6-diaminopimelate ligase [Magnetococcales bacterium]